MFRSPVSANRNHPLCPLVFLALTLMCSVGWVQGGETLSIHRDAADKQNATLTEPADIACHLEPCRQQFLTAFAKAESELRRQEDLDVAECMQQLQSKELLQEVTRNPPDLARLQALSHCFYGTAPVLQHAAVVQLRSAWTAYIHAVTLARSSNLPATYRWHLVRLEEQLAADRSLRDEDILRRHVAWLHWLNKVPRVAQEAQKQAAFRNFVVAVHKDLLQPYLREMNKDVNETESASNVIVGAQVTGKVQTRGSARPVLDFQSSVPKLRIQYVGISQAPDSLAVSGPVTIRNRSVTTIDANTNIFWDGRHAVASPTITRCATTITQLGISVNRPRGLFSGRLVDRIIENTAMRRAGEQRAQAEQEVSDITRRDVTSQINEEVAAFTTYANEQFEKFFAKPALRAGIGSQVQLGTEGDYLTVGLTQFDAAHMAADRPPSWKPMKAGTVVSIHQSALTGFTQKLCGGALWHDSDFSDLQRLVTGLRSEELKINQQQRWALQLDWLQPFSMQIEPDGIQFTIRARAITYNGKTLACPIRIDAKYRLEPADITLNGLRDGEVQVACLAGAEGSEAVRQRVAHFLQHKFSGFFRKHVYLDGITIPTGESSDSMKTFFVQEVQSQSGWLYLAIDSKDADSTRLVNQTLKLFRPD